MSNPNQFNPNSSDPNFTMGNFNPNAAANGYYMNNGYMANGNQGSAYYNPNYAASYPSQAPQFGSNNIAPQGNVNPNMAQNHYHGQATSNQVNMNPVFSTGYSDAMLEEMINSPAMIEQMRNYYATRRQMEQIQQMQQSGQQSYNPSNMGQQSYNPSNMGQQSYNPSNMGQQMVNNSAMMQQMANHPGMSQQQQISNTGNYSTQMNQQPFINPGNTNLINGNVYPNISGANSSVTPPLADPNSSMLAGAALHGAQPLVHTQAPVVITNNGAAINLNATVPMQLNNNTMVVSPPVENGVISTNATEQQAHSFPITAQDVLPADFSNSNNSIQDTQADSDSSEPDLAEDVTSLVSSSDTNLATPITDTEQLTEISSNSQDTQIDNFASEYNFDETIMSLEPIINIIDTNVIPTTEQQTEGSSSTQDTKVVSIETIMPLLSQTATGTDTNINTSNIDISTIDAIQEFDFSNSDQLLLESYDLINSKDIDNFFALDPDFNPDLHPDLDSDLNFNLENFSSLSQNNSQPSIGVGGSLENSQQNTSNGTLASNVGNTNITTGFDNNINLSSLNGLAHQQQTFQNTTNIVGVNTAVVNTMNSINTTQMVNNINPNPVSNEISGTAIPNTMQKTQNVLVGTSRKHFLEGSQSSFSMINTNGPPLKKQNMGNMTNNNIQYSIPISVGGSREGGVNGSLSAATPASIQKNAMVVRRANDIKFVEGKPSKPRKYKTKKTNTESNEEDVPTTTVFSTNGVSNLPFDDKDISELKMKVNTTFSMAARFAPIKFDKATSDDAFISNVESFFAQHLKSLNYPERKREMKNEGEQSKHLFHPSPLPSNKNDKNKNTQAIEKPQYPNEPVKIQKIRQDIGVTLRKLCRDFSNIILTRMRLDTMKEGKELLLQEYEKALANPDPQNEKRIEELKELLDDMNIAIARLDSTFLREDVDFGNTLNRLQTNLSLLKEYAENQL